MENQESEEKNEKKDGGTIKTELVEADQKPL